MAAQGRKQYWEDILNIAKELGSLGLERTPVYLEIDPKICPRFSGPDSSCQRLLGAITGQRLSPAIMAYFQSKCIILQEQTILRYKNTVTNMESLYAETAIDDRKRQAEISAAFEKWYEQSEAELISAIRESLGEKKQTKDISTCGKMEKLHQAFEMSSSPNDKEREVLAEACGMTYKQVTTWFQNQRQRNKEGNKHARLAPGSKKGSVARDESARQPIANGQMVTTLKKGPTASKKRTKSKGHNEVVQESGEGSTSLPTLTELRVEQSTSAPYWNDASSNGRDALARTDLSSGYTTVSPTRPSALATSNLAATLPLTSHKPLRKIRKLPTARNKKVTPSMNPTCVVESIAATELPKRLTTDLTGSSRVPSLTRSVSTASADNEACPTETSADDNWAFTGPASTAKDRTTSLSDAYVESGEQQQQQQQQYQSPLAYRPIRRMRELKTPRALPALNAVEADRQQPVLPSVSAMLPSEASPAHPATFHLMTDAAGTQYIVPVSSAIPVSYPMYQQPRVMWHDEHEKDLRTVSYAVSGSNRFEKIPTPAASNQSGSRLSTPETSTEATPSPYQTPRMQVKHTASMTIAPAAAEYAPSQVERTMSYTGSPADIPLPAPTYDELYPIDPRLEQQPQYQSRPQSEQAVLPEVSVDGVPFAFAEPEAESFVTDDETLRDMEALLGMDAGATGSFDAAVDVSPASTQSVPYEEKNEGQYTQITAGTTQEESLPGSEGTVELVGLQGSSGLTHSSATQPVYAYDYASSSGAATADCGPLSGPTYAPPQTPTPAPSQVVDHEQRFPLTVYPQLLTSNSHPVSHSRGVPTSMAPLGSGSEQTPIPQYVYYSEAQCAQQPGYVYSHPLHMQIQVQSEQPMQMQFCQAQQPQASGWNYNWEWDVLPFEGVEMGEMFTLDQ